MIVNRLFTKKVNGVTHKVLEGKEIPKGFFTAGELTDLEKGKSIFKDEKARQDYKKSEKSETLKAVKSSAEKMKKLADSKKPKKVTEDKKEVVSK